MVSILGLFDSLLERSLAVMVITKKFTTNKREDNYSDVKRIQPM